MSTPEVRLPISDQIPLQGLEVALQLRVADLAEKVFRRHLLGEMGSDSGVEDRRARDSKEMLQVLAGDRFGSVRQIYRELDQGLVRGNERVRVREGLLLVEEAVLMVVNHDPAMTDRAIFKPETMDDIYPVPLKGLRRVAERVIRDGKVRAIVDFLNRKYKTVQNDGQMSGVYQRAIDELDVLLREGENADASLVAGFLNLRVASIEEMPVVGREVIDLTDLAAAVADGVREAIEGRESLEAEREAFLRAKIVRTDTPPRSDKNGLMW